jgi:hypothetical protein
MMSKSSSARFWLARREFTEYHVEEMLVVESERLVKGYSSISFPRAFLQSASIWLFGAAS